MLKERERERNFCFIISIVHKTYFQNHVLCDSLLKKTKVLSLQTLNSCALCSYESYLSFDFFLPFLVMKTIKKEVLELCGMMEFLRCWWKERHKECLKKILNKDWKFYEKTFKLLQTCNVGVLLWKSTQLQFFCSFWKILKSQSLKKYKSK